ncbi:DUF4180 domain-containing protein [Granulicella arctica]|uniref:DUF4180 domain-containing protein n=1 Tax=Granulicella arctica TaxID=940613 RepID=A0A7Y9PGJ9_9BACT|nr:DUF4180 domain-containing protein [Granulicella arctica]NYF78738.1 hypothetical protein [Granulicella arctica]
MDRVIKIGETRVLMFGCEGPRLQSLQDANDFLSAAWSQQADLLAIPSERLGPDFLTLSTRVAGEVFQKFVNYHLRCAIVGDISIALEDSRALRDFVRETNQGNLVWFVADVDELGSKLAAV